jgi:hypothetical protein
MRARSILCVLVASLCLATTAQAATDPLFVFTPPLPPPAPQNVPPPTGNLYGPCGIAVDSSGRYFVSDYYHHVIDVFNGTFYQSQLANVDPLDGPCGLALDATNRLYVNNYHRNVVRYNAAPSFGAGTVITGAPLDSSHPTGVAVNPTTGHLYVNKRDHIAVYDSAGNPVEEAGQPLKIGLGSLGEGYGVAVSQFPATEGRLYVPDASSNTVKVYDPVLDPDTPVAEIKDPFSKPFVSLKDSAIAVDKETGDVYFADNLQPKHTERPQASIYVYGPTGLYQGRLKYNVIDALPPGLAVDNSTFPSSQGTVYVTSGNSTRASVYAYGPGSATFAEPLPPLGSGLPAPGGSSGVTSSEMGTSQAASGAGAQASAMDSPAARASEVVQEENLRVSVEGKLSPKRLPREGRAPISVSVGWQISTTDGSPPPKLKGLQIEINKEGRFDTAGLPTCPYAKIQPATTQRALANCRSALVGQGSFSAQIALKGQEGEGYAASGRLLVFNGEAGGKPVLFGQIYSPRPFATSFVITFDVKELSKGAYGTVLTTTLPPALRSWGNLTAIEMKLERRYGFKGKQRSYISAGCPAPKGFGLASFKLARTEFSFNGGKELASTVVGDCRVRG